MKPKKINLEEGYSLKDIGSLKPNGDFILYYYNSYGEKTIQVKITKEILEKIFKGMEFLKGVKNETTKS